MPANLQLHSFKPRQATPGGVEELATPLTACITVQQPDRLAPRRTRWRHELTGCAGAAHFTFLPHSCTVLAFE